MQQSATFPRRGHRVVFGKDGKKYTLFYGGVFSNFYPCSKLVIKECAYQCTEQFYMFKKARFFGDTLSALRILQTTRPTEMKAIGRSVKNFNADQWAEESINVMIECNVHKYLQNDELRSQLENADGTTMAEASPTDLIWGIGLTMYDPMVLDRSNWRGKNMLGRILEEIRHCLLNKMFDENAEAIIQYLQEKFRTICKPSM